MTRGLPSLEVYPPGALTCAICGEEMRLANFCPTCFEAEVQKFEALRVAREEAVRRDFAVARKRARAWQLGRAVSQ